MKIAFIAPRYSAEVLEGPEYLCRLIAEKMTSRHVVEVLTTCARDNITWKNDYPEGIDRVRGVTIRRFQNARTRDAVRFERQSEWIFSHAHSREDEAEWLKQAGPWSPSLVRFIEQHHRQYDALIFFTWLHAPTVLGVRIAPERSILVPVSYDEPAIHLDMYEEVFARPAGIAYSSEVERAFLRSRFEMNAVAEETIGCGVELPQHRAYRRPRSDETGATHAGEDGKSGQRGAHEAADAAGGGGEDLEPRTGYRSRLMERGAVFRRRHRLHGPFVLFAGHVHRGNGCEELIEYFDSYVTDGGEASLVMMGAKMMPLPEEPFINFAGMLPERERAQALEAATAVVIPSPDETLGLLALESFAVGTPMLGNARSDVLVEHATRSNAGLYYADRDEFVECLKLLVAEERLRAAMGRNGRNYVRNNFRWDVVLGKYERMIARIKSSK